MKVKSFFFSLLLIVLSLSSEGKFLEHSVGIYISEKGQQFFKSNLLEIMENNGFSPDKFSIPKSTFTLKESSLSSMIEDPELIDLASNIKGSFNRYFNGLEFKETHQFQIDVGDIEFKANWNEAGVEFRKPLVNEISEPYEVLAYIWINASNIDIKISSISARDLNHLFLGDVGLDGLHIKQLDESENLRIGLPLKLKKNGANDFEIIAEAPNSNTRDILFDMDFTSPIRIPEIKVSINGHEASLNLEEVETLFKDNETLILSKIQETLKEQLEEKFPAIVKTEMSKVLNGGFSEKTEMLPPGAPEGRTPKPLVSQMRIEDIDFKGDNLHIGVGLELDDPSASKQRELPPSHHAQKQPNLKSAKEENYDLTIAVNQGFINRIVQLTAYRQYFSNMPLGNGQTISLAYPPVFNLKGKNKKPSLSVVISYTVEGLAAIAVKNPIQIEMDLLLDFPIDQNTKRIGIEVSGVDMSTVHVPDRFIRMMAGVVRNSAVKQVGKLQGSIKGMKLAEELPVPTDFSGIILEKQDVEVNESGYLMIYTNYGN